MSLNHVYEPSHSASEIVRVIRAVEGPAAIECLRDVLDLAYIKGKLDGVTDGINAVATGINAVVESVAK
jgi:hypothetical protein